MTNLQKEVRLFMIFDILGDTERTGPHLWQIKRDRLEDVKNHVLDLLLIVRLLRKYLPDTLDYDKITDYIICHDLPEAITGDITKFEGVSQEEITRVTKIAIDYLADNFNDVMDFKTILNNYEQRADIESKVVHMIDKVHSSTTFIKYQSEQPINVNDPNIIPELRNLPFVVERIAQGLDVADIFYEFHIRAVTITDEECEKYGISRQDADKIVAIIKTFAAELYNEKINGTLLDAKKDFPKEAMQYNRANKKTSQ